MQSPVFFQSPLIPSDRERLLVVPPSDVAERREVDLSWYNLSLEVSMQQSLCAEPYSKTILSKCWGSICSGELCAVMGPSGSGKTSMLNVLAGRATAAGTKATCTLFVCGERVDPVENRHRIAYLTQDDGLMATATPREALRFSAQLRLPPMNGADADRLVQQIIGELDLADCADMLIGGGRIAGISGGTVLCGLLLVYGFLSAYKSTN